MKDCELCRNPASMYCESDQASLCWDCDEKVHSANFLVARHCRSLLCHVCQAATPWKASGSKLGPTVSVCADCAGKRGRCVEADEESQAFDGEDDDDDVRDDDDEEEEAEEQDEDEGEDEGENQVVPWSLATPPPVASSSSSEGESSTRLFSAGRGGSALKRLPEDADLSSDASDDEIGCSYSHPNCSAPTPALHSRTLAGAGDDDEATSFRFIKPLKQQKISEATRPGKIQNHDVSESRSTAIISSIKRFHDKIISGNGDTSATILSILQLSRDPRAVDLVSDESTIPNPTV